MNTISWNCRGLGNPRAIREVSKLIRAHNPQVLFLMETRKRNSETDWIRSLCQFDNCFVVDANGRAGGLALLWMNNTNLSIQSYSKNHIDAIIDSRELDCKWRITGFYGHPDVKYRHVTWNLLRTLANNNNLPWLCLGDFNEILSNSEKFGGNLKPEMQMNNFRNTLADCNLIEFPFIGPPFTWSRGKDEDIVLERLDRAFATESWWNIFPNIHEVHLSHSYSDHCPILINEKQSSSPNRGMRKGIFRFERYWTEYEGCKNTVEQVWRAIPSYRVDDISSKLQNCT